MHLFLPCGLVRASLDCVARHPSHVDEDTEQRETNQTVRNLLVVHKDVNEATYNAIFIDDALAQTWIGSIELVQNDA